MSGDQRAGVAAEVLAGFAEVQTATVASELYKRGILRSVMVGVAPIVAPPAYSVAGIARTLRQIPAREDVDSHAASRGRDTLLYDLVDSIEPAQIVVVDARGELSGGVAGGGIVAERLAQRGAAAIVTDGALRDVAHLERLGLPAYGGGRSPGNRKTALHIADLDVAIGCGGAAVYPGDVLVADRDGVVVVPAHLAADVLADARRVERAEEQVVEHVRSGRPLKGRYPLPPPNAEEASHTSPDS